MLDRRAFMTAAAAAAILPGPVHARSAGAFVGSDFGRLRRVMVCEPAEADFAPSLTNRDLFDLPNGKPEDMVREHRQLQALLRGAGADVLEFEEVLQSAVEAARKKGQLRVWLRAVLPRLARDPDAVTGAMLLGRDPRTQFEATESGDYAHVMDVQIGKMFVRDQGVMTPKGFLLSNLHPPHRRAESQLMRFALDFAPALARYPVVFDSAVEGYYAEGGDFQLVDENTLFVGVGNRTDPRIAPLLAKRLGMDVVAVQTRKVEALKWKVFDEIRSRLLHLDTYFTHTGPKRALALPWILEKEFAGQDVMTRYLNGLLTLDTNVKEDEIEGAIKFLKDFGRVRRFHAHTGQEDKSIGEIKLVDYVRSQGYDVQFVGGPPPPSPNFEHMFRTVLAEHARQAANVVATAPNDVISYDGGARTIDALRRSGVKVATFPGRELWIGNGGPHCLTLPLERS